MTDPQEEVVISIVPVASTSQGDRPPADGMDAITALLLLRKHQARATWGQESVMVEEFVQGRRTPEGFVEAGIAGIGSWQILSREDTFVHAVMKARDARGWRL